MRTFGLPAKIVGGIQDLSAAEPLQLSVIQQKGTFAIFQLIYWTLVADGVSITRVTSLIINIAQA